MAEKVTQRFANAVGVSVSITQPAGRREFRDTTQALLEKSILEKIIAGKDPVEDAGEFKTRIGEVYHGERAKHAALAAQEHELNLQLHRQQTRA